MNLRSVRSTAEKLAQRSVGRRPPIDVEAIAVSLGLRVLYQDLGDEISGLLVSGPKEEFIVVHEGQGKNRQRFTIAHEIAHHCLQHQFARGEHVHVDRGYAITPRGPDSSTGRDRKEIEANQFAAALLMPEYLLYRQIQRLGISALLDDDVSSLAEIFAVSEQAMTIRLSGLGLI
jgi:Zn-dependent peptidase ImmA (M78 family)